MQKTVLPPAERARVAAAFVEDRHRLEHLLGRDLSVWEAHNA
jgi:hypothetical protein